MGHQPCLLIYTNVRVARFSAKYQEVRPPKLGVAPPAKLGVALPPRLGVVPLARDWSWLKHNNSDEPPRPHMLSLDNESCGRFGLGRHRFMGIAAWSGI